MNKHRRAFLTYFGVTGACALSLTSFTKLGTVLGLSKSFTDLSLFWKGRKERAVDTLMERYGISGENREKARKLLDQMMSEMGEYALSSAVMGPSFCVASNVAIDKAQSSGMIKNIFSGSAKAPFSYRFFFNIFASSELMRRLALRGRNVFNITQESPLTNKQTLIDEYGLSPENAEKFRQHHLRSLSLFSDVYTAGSAAVYEFARSKESGSGASRPRKAEPAIGGGVVIDAEFVEVGREGRRFRDSADDDEQPLP